MITGRPKVVVYAEASLDGRITVAPDVLLLFGDDRWPSAGDPSEALAQIREIHSPQANLEGSGSFVLPESELEPLVPVSGNPARLYADFLLDDIARRPGFRGWFVVVDGGGRVRWYYTGEPGKEAPGSEGWHLLVLASRATPPEYLAYLQSEHVPYLVAGDDRVDLARALAKLKGLLDVDCVLCTSPGKLGGALLRAGLVDEINVLWLPAVIGGTKTPSLFECPELGPDERPTKLSLISSRTCSGGSVWLRYRVENVPEGEKA
ncbi:MAG: dihydrofolate reductase family protein [Candidatus Bipolaricaulis sp.]|nr:dihydrofolate reductase family protein [Candidatus Bipolaricaulis sp.]